MASKKLIIVVGILVVGGVMGLTWLGGDMVTSPSSVTDPAPPSDDSLEGHNGSTLPRGVNIDGVVAQSLNNEYDSALDRSTYTLTVTTTIEQDNETRVEETTYEKSHGGTYAQTSVNGELHVERYADTDTTTLYTRKHTEDGVEVSTQTGRTLSASNSNTLLNIFEGGDFRPVDLTTDENGVRKVELKANSAKHPSELKKFVPLTTINSFSGHATVDTNQLIWTSESVVKGTRNTSNVTVTYSSELELVNKTNIDQPQWVDDASDNSVGYRSGLSSDGRSMFVSHDNGPTVPAGTSIDVYVEEDGQYTLKSVTLDEDFSKNQSIYLTIDDGSPVIQRGAVPSEQGDELTADAYYVEFITSPEEDPVIEFEVVP